MTLTRARGPRDGGADEDVGPSPPPGRYHRDGSCPAAARVGGASVRAHHREECGVHDEDEREEARERGRRDAEAAEEGVAEGGVDDEEKQRLGGA